MPARPALVKPLDPRVDMPEIAEWIDMLRAKLGAELINGAMKRGMQSGGFWAIEGSYVVGRPPRQAVEDALRRLELERALAAEMAAGLTPDEEEALARAVESAEKRLEQFAGADDALPADPGEDDYQRSLAAARSDRN